MSPTTSTTMIDLPIIDISSFVEDEGISGCNDTTERQIAAMKALLEACETYGAFHIVGHGLGEDAFEKAYQAADKFFELPQEVKSTIPIKKGGFTRGYIGVGMQKCVIFD
jgi:isopenicillin N synthase-like dioxygenase